MAFEGDSQLVTRNAQAIVLHPDAAHATRQQSHHDLRGLRIHRVVHQLANHACGALNDLSSRDLADQLVGQFADGAASFQSGHRGGIR